MVNKVCDFRGFPVYEDKYMLTDKITRGHTEGKTTFIIVAPNVATKIRQFMRNDKLEDILGDV